MFNLINLSDQTFLVTGASSGIGRATAILISKVGGKAVLVGRNEEELNKTVGMMAGEGHIISPFDLNDVDAIPKWIKTVVENSGPLSGITHCAGISNPLSIGLLNQKRINGIMTINFNAAVMLTRGFRQKGIAAENGSIVYISSVAGLIGQPGQTIYAASKGALLSMCRAAAMELASKNIRVNCVAPAQVMSEMGKESARVLPPEKFKELEDAHPLGFGTPEDIANVVVFLLSDASKWITGTTITIDGGFTAH